jgi:hypothetical protein
MLDLTLISSFFWGGVNGVITDAKFIASVGVAAVGTAATVLRNLAEIRQDRSKLGRAKLETARVAELLDLLAKVPAGDPGSACKKELELQLAHSLCALDAYRAKRTKLARAPNHDLTVWQRLFISFPPCVRRAWVIHGLAYLFMVGGPLAIVMLILFGVDDAGLLGDVTVLIVFGSLAFRAWALAERKWAMEPAKPVPELIEPAQIESGPLATIFVLRKPTGWKMLAAQICMWTCLFCAMESLEDIFLAGMDANQATHADTTKAQGEKANAVNPGSRQIEKSALAKAQDDAKAGLLLFLASLLGAGICKAWAGAEWQSGSTLPAITFAKAILPMPKLATPKAWFLTAGFVAATASLIVSVVAWFRIFDDLIDRIEFTFVWLTACTACNRLLNLHLYNARHSKGTQSAASSESVAA